MVNNIDEDALLYQNRSNDNQNQDYVQIMLKGSEKNINAIGSKVIVFSGKKSEVMRNILRKVFYPAWKFLCILVLRARR